MASIDDIIFKIQTGNGPLNYDHAHDDDTVQIEAFIMPTWHSWMSEASFYTFTTTFATKMADHENSNSITEKRGTSQLRIRGLIVRGDLEYSLADFVCKL